jgi:hypothetical protein
MVYPRALLAIAAIVAIIVLVVSRQPSGGIEWFPFFDTADADDTVVTTTAAATSASTSTGVWKSAYSTYYDSYPPCCKDAPNYDPKAPKSECSDYSGCKYMGQFAGVDGKLSYEDVKSRNIVAFYDAAHQKKGPCAKSGECAWWNSNVKGKRLEIKNPTTGATMIVEPLDTCSDGDCSGCCTKNAKKGGGTLIDMEINTALRFWGKPKNGKIQWRWV